jgi:hypothetical protein
MAGPVDRALNGLQESPSSYLPPMLASNRVKSLIQGGFMNSWWSAIDAVARFSQLMEVAVVLFSGLSLAAIYFLRKSDRRLLELFNQQDLMSTRRLKSVETAAGDIRKEMLDAQQERDILEQRLRVKEAEFKKIHTALDAVKQKQAAAEKILKERNLGLGKVADGASETTVMPAAPVSALSREQREQLVALLDPGPKGDIDILAVMGEEKSYRLAKELEDIFSADGWTTNGVIQSAFSQIPEGLILSVQSKDTAPSYASFIQRTMATVGFPITAAVNRKYREWSLTLVVGRPSDQCGQ